MRGEGWGKERRWMGQDRIGRERIAYGGVRIGYVGQRRG